MNYKGLIEGLLFVAGDEGLTTKKISEIIEIEEEKVNATLNELIEE